MIYIEYLILAFFVVFLSIKLGNYVDVIDRRTKLSGAFLGGVVLAAVTSLPELFTSISACLIVNEPNLVVGDILGSNIFNITVLAILFIVSYKGFCSSNIAKSHKSVTFLTLISYLVLALPIALNISIKFFSIDVISIIILFIYVLSVKKMAQSENICSECEEQEESKLFEVSLKNIAFRFILCSVLLILASVFITIVTDEISEKLNLGTTMAGALFLGIATSLPEVTSSITLIKLKNYNATAGNILGSNMFNLFILFIADVIYFKGSIYIPDSTLGVHTQTRFLYVFLVISSLLIFWVIKRKTNEKSYIIKGKNKVFIFSLLLLCIVSYILFLIFGSYAN